MLLKIEKLSLEKLKLLQKEQNYKRIVFVAMLDYKIYQIEEINKLKAIEKSTYEGIEYSKNNIIKLLKSKNNNNFNNCINIILNNINIKLNNLQKNYNLDELKNYKYTRFTT